MTANDILMDKLAQKACKSAIKSGDKLREQEESLNNKNQFYNSELEKLIKE